MIMPGTKAVLRRAGISTNWYHYPMQKYQKGFKGHWVPGNCQDSAFLEFLL
jgi:hypothetical protein